MKDMHSPMDKTAWILIIIGAVNWGLIGLFDFNLVEALIGAWPMVVRVVYTLVGLAGLYVLLFSCKSCMAVGKK